MGIIKDWLKLFKDDDFQQDLVFLVIITILRAVNIITSDTFQMLASIIIAGDAVKKLGKR